MNAQKYYQEHVSSSGLQNSLRRCHPHVTEQQHFEDKLVYVTLKKGLQSQLTHPYC
jgi:hypothetical protein